SALLSKKGASHRLMVWLFQQRKKYSVVSNTLVTEFEDVLTREKNIKLFNKLTKDDVLSFIDDICLISYQQKIHFLWRPFLKDKNDDMVLEVAVNANVEAIITFNPKDFEGVKESFDIEILTPKEYLTQIGEIQ
ncbi:putative toxin-antitoxin system toxin component, PIN family, partial [Sulfurovum sp. bin170]|uniref:putative toxin-antitoxin system toxin component, PIN family n=1 Tax=Sulfurovum sp. bin170 TaxID=2695268 RepID=UPI0013DEE86E